MNKPAKASEGMDILALMESANDDNIICDELTKGRIRTIYVQLRYGKKYASVIAEYYDLPVQLIRDIGAGKIFRSITSESYVEPKK